MNPNIPEHIPVEQLFLDLPIQHVIDNKAGMPATLYVNAIREQRFGDAIWVRYNIARDVEDGIKVRDDIPGNTNQTVLEVIKEDALNYRVIAPGCQGHVALCENEQYRWACICARDCLQSFGE
ncbi:uncharacterized protein N7473_003099 [Penicillium subrubescens]|uniref:uncharacterized protein n=1 Tax=Penicillium subrubescens TaxID=1316194 RepID=UPI00254580BC|nr:uncharacterized protein N7473_003099 [Penicillium subrubescens]KAJ5906183.1 hypothetical protein N7473_003099 [Penicillium subrubescens]